MRKREKSVILNSSERAVMELLWEKNPQTVTELFHVLKENPGWSKSTVNTMLSRMSEKGLIRMTQGEKAKLYAPEIEKKSADFAETESLIERVYKGSVSMMMSTLVRERKLDAAEIEELKSMLDEL
ncbi:MAG: BlaI/MecI/CopY family transcriptional regulator [Lachnospiraceae bacterium]|nr:BlaI/MecI/CopY family transcriptional regulator [Lachnospiraceae bacterium]